MVVVCEPVRWKSRRDLAYGFQELDGSLNETHADDISLIDVRSYGVVSDQDGYLRYDGIRSRGCVRFVYG